MRKAIKLYVLLGVLLVVCVAAFAVSRYEEKKEEIKNSGEVILAISTDDVTALSWTNESGTFSFSKGENWTYDEDVAFPVDEEKMQNLLEQFSAFTAAFTIENVEDYEQYGLDEPVCTISITANETEYTIELGDFSKMDEERYVSLGDGSAYLAEHDPYEEFDATLRDMILDDVVPEFDVADQLTFNGTESYTVVRDEDAKSICEDDVFFTEGKPLDTSNVESYLSDLSSVELTNYVSYNVTDEELETYGLDSPEQTVTLDYSTTDEEGNVEETGSVTFSVSRNPEELAAYEEAVAQEEEDLPSVTCYARVGESQIVYKITQAEYEDLTDVSYDTLRHQKLFTADFDTATSIDVSLDGESYRFMYNPPEEDAEEDAEGTWIYQNEEFDISDIRSALCAVCADSFTEEEPTNQEEISLTIHLDNEDFQTFTMTLYRYDGTDCIAMVDQTPIAFVPRSQMVDLVEAVNQLTLGNETTE